MNVIKLNICLIILINYFGCYRISCLSHTTSDNSANTNRNSDKYLKHIFKKYGNDGYITYEGLEHLMYSLGIGGFEFTPFHSIEEHHHHQQQAADGFSIPDLILDEAETVFNENEKNLGNNHPHHTLEISDLTAAHQDEDYVKDSEEEDQNASRETKKEDIDSTVDDEKAIWVNEIFNDMDIKDQHGTIRHRHIRHHDKLLDRCLSPLAMVKIYFEISHLQKQSKLNYKVSKTMLNNENDDELMSESTLERREKRSFRDHSHDSKYLDDNLVVDVQQLENDVDGGEDDEFLHIRSSSIKITPEIFMKMCPTILSQIETGSCHIYKHEENVGVHKNAWIFASISILIISLCGLSGVALIPLTKSMSYNEVLRFLVSIAVGTLCGDALMHLLPHALTPHLEHGHDSIPSPSSNGISDEPVWICACAFFSALFMYLIETGLPILTGNTTGGHGHSHSLAADRERPNENHKRDDNTIEMNSSVGENGGDKEINVMLDENCVDSKSDKLAPVAFMVIIGDALHNVTDGLAIGAAFASNITTGMATALAVLCHELPHELGDFALLLSTGVSIRKAMYYNILSSVLSFMGMILGIMIAQMHTSVVRWIYSGTAGSFLYIAFADLIPELNREGKHMKMVLLQVAGITLGGVIMLLIGLNEDRLRILFE